MIIIPGVPSSYRVPGVYVAVEAVAQAGTVQPRTLIVGSETGTYTSALGIVSISGSASEVDALFGAGSDLAQACYAYRAVDKLSDLYALPVAAGGTAASGTITISSGPATADGTLYLYIGGRSIPITIVTGQTDTQTAAAIIAAITAAYGCPVTAVLHAPGSGQVDVTAIPLGERGNLIEMCCALQGVLLEPSVPGVDITIVQLTGGATGTAFSATLLADDRYDRIIVTNVADLPELGTELERRWGPLVRQHGHGYSATCGALGAVQAIAVAENDPHLTLIGCATGYRRNPWEYCAAAVARITLKAAEHVLLPFVGLKLGLEGCQKGIAPWAGADWTTTDRQSHYYAGVTPLTTINGEAALERVITTYTTNSSQLDVQRMQGMGLIADETYAALAAFGAGKLLANDGTRYGVGAPVATPSTVRGECLRLAQDWETRAILEDYATFASGLIVERDSVDNNRVNVRMPPNLVDMLLVTGVLIRAQ